MSDLRVLLGAAHTYVVSFSARDGWSFGEAARGFFFFEMSGRLSFLSAVARADYCSRIVYYYR